LPRNNQSGATLSQFGKGRKRQKPLRMVQLRDSEVNIRVCQVVEHHSGSS